jgi:hypothetical protein
MSEQIYIPETVDKWVKYDADIFRHIDREWDIVDFYRFLDEPHSEDGEGLALLQKGIILFNGEVYVGAAYSLAQYRINIRARSPTRNELRITAGLLGCRYGFADLVARRVGERQGYRVVAARTLAHIDPDGIRLTTALAYQASIVHWGYAACISNPAIFLQGVRRGRYGGGSWFLVPCWRTTLESAN